jgi:hypothetical protein
VNSDRVYWRPLKLIVSEGGMQGRLKDKMPLEVLKQTRTTKKAIREIYTKNEHSTIYSVRM